VASFLKVFEARMDFLVYSMAFLWGKNECPLAGPSCYFHPKVLLTVSYITHMGSWALYLIGNMTDMKYGSHHDESYRWAGQDNWEVSPLPFPD
jgi:hypothetical protein